MAISLFDMLKVGIGPSSSHTVGPMTAARRFARGVQKTGRLHEVVRVDIQLFGSVGATGKGHGTGPAVLLGLEGQRPDRIDPAILMPRMEKICNQGTLNLNGEHAIRFSEKDDLTYHRQQSLPYHPNGMRFTAFDADGRVLRERTYYSVGGGFVVDEKAAGADRIVEDKTPLPYPFKTGEELLRQCDTHALSIAEVMLANEQAWRSVDEIRDGILHIWEVMQECVRNGISNEGILPGGLKVKRRAASLHALLIAADRKDLISPSLSAMDWVNLYALAVNEENAAGGRMVTAPTNGAAGIIPAVLHYYWNWCPDANEEGVIRFLLTAAAIGILFKENASISGAEVGCQGEVGSACAMAAAGLAAATGGTPRQVENAAEIGMEHHLGLTCDPIGGLVQVPCIERNAVGAVKAINAAVMALRGNGEHFVSLDKVIRTMRDTGRDMLDKYKETSRGGLAVNVIEC
ncbi:L-serine ammonia-lyase [Marinobacter nanhaiticus D15-8W]|uniref:L-serine dehydratase n=1 Tax=Marinobacter nanhaiticus D15-8W TaxID=626887 RepID=N6VV10_9GAMM|nr:L-serine ammonia-lyase [Marinobacter nanhaiticus]ENO14015.1 L-serine ammonia-lyase [Marinobacter nanhaiticus D15-8W]BES71393.1 L-serine ammonia-lyase [Marinobacter nanhaiticus D15-8W]